MLAMARYFQNKMDASKLFIKQKLERIQMYVPCWFNLLDYFNCF